MGLWSFVKRHKKKVIGSAFIFGGGYVAWQVLKPRIYDYFLQKLLKQMGEGDLLKDFMADLEDPEHQKARKRAKFDHNQQVADNHTQKALDALEERLMACFKVDECSQALAKAQNKEEKLHCIGALQVECLARSMSAVYTLHLLLLLHRVEFNIVGREMLGPDGNVVGGSAAESQDTEALTAFVVSVSYVQEDGLPRICEAVREAVKARWAADSIQPVTKVTAERLESFLLDVCRAADSSLLANGKAPATLLPESLDSSATPKVKQLLDEARDYVESPQFLDVFRSVLTSALTHFVGSLGETTETAEPTRGPPLPKGASVPIAKLGGDCVTRSQAMLASGDSAGFVRRFGDEPLVSKLCEALYFEEPAQTIN
jgi:hypothetical protein